MRSTADYYPYASSSDYEALSLPYTGGADMLVILPRDGKFAQVARALEGDGLDGVMSGEMNRREVVVGLPKFTFRIPLGLKESLQALGMRDAFVAGVADFSGMYAGAMDEKLHVSHVLHEAFVAVDEAGTEAAAATAVVMKAESASMDLPLQFTADRPFFFVIRHTATNTPLFVGRVMDPTKKK
jgi:serpin B